MIYNYTLHDKPEERRSRIYHYHITITIFYYRLISISVFSQTLHTSLFLGEFLNFGYFYVAGLISEFSHYS
jgi:hypothetical protein